MSENLEALYRSMSAKLQSQKKSYKIDRFIELMPIIDRGIQDGYPLHAILNYLAENEGWKASASTLKDRYWRARQKAAKLQAARAAAGAANPIASATASAAAVAATTVQARPAAAPIPAPATVKTAASPVSHAAPIAAPIAAPVSAPAPVVAAPKPATPAPVSSVAVLRTGESFTWKGKDGKERRYKVKLGPGADDLVIDAEALDVAALPRCQRVWVRYKRDPRLAIPVERFFPLPTQKVSMRALHNHRAVIANAQAMEELHRGFGNQHDWWLPLDENNPNHAALFDFSVPMGKEYRELGGLIWVTQKIFADKFIAGIKKKNDTTMKRPYAKKVYWYSYYGDAHYMVYKTEAEVTYYSLLEGMRSVANERLWTLIEQKVLPRFFRHADRLPSIGEGALFAVADIVSKPALSLYTQHEPALAAELDMLIRFGVLCVDGFFTNNEQPLPFDPDEFFTPQLMAQVLRHRLAEYYGPEGESLFIDEAKPGTAMSDYLETAIKRWGMDDYYWEGVNDPIMKAAHALRGP